MTDPVSSWRRATVAELGWLAPHGPAGIPAVPLLRDDRLCVALPFSWWGRLPGLDRGRATFTVTETSGDAPRGVMAAGRVSLEYDTEGRAFTGDLLDQEIVKHPPTRLLADGAMARRDNWWWVARLLVTLTDVEAVRPLPWRSRATDALLLREREGHAWADVVTAPAWPAEGTIRLFERAGAEIAGGGEPAVALGHGRSPDHERWESWYRRGTLIGDELRLTAAEGAPSQELPPMSLMQRYRDHRALARECRRGIAAAERAGE